MSKAIVFATIAKLCGWRGLSTALFLGIIVPLWASSQCKEPMVAQLVKSAVLTGPLLPVLVSYSLINDSLSNSRSLTDGEYLSLLFTRPLTRSNYVLTKWITCSALVSLLVYLQLTVFQLSENAFGRVDASLLTNYRLADVVLNSLSITALMVLINAFPPKIGIYIFLGLVYATVVGGMLPDIAMIGSKSEIMAFYSAISTYLGFLRTCLTPTINTSDIFETTRFTYLPLVAFVSNISVYLSLATMLLNKREFFYASN